MKPPKAGCCHLWFLLLPVLALGSGEKSVPVASQGQVQAQSNPSSSKILEGIYKFIWPAGRFKGKLSNVIGMGIQKSGNGSGQFRLYLVDAGTKGTSKEWRSARGAVEPSVSPYGDWLFYRRGSAIWCERLSQDKNGLRSASEPLRMESPPARHLFACSTTGKDSLFLWVQSETGTKVLRFQGGKVFPVEAPLQRLGIAWDADTVGGILERVKGIRPNGEISYVIGTTLVIDSADRPEKRIQANDSLDYAGSPVWIPGANNLFITMKRKPL
jgi:hypothetical protein